MTLYELCFAIALGAPMVAIIVSLVLNRPDTSKWNSWLLAASGVAGIIAAGSAAISEEPISQALPLFYGMTIAIDRFSAIFFISFSLILATIGVFSSAIGPKLKGIVNLRILGIFTALFVIGAQWTFLAGNIIGFLAAWSTMIIATFALVLTDSSKAGTRSALRYLAIALVGLGALTAGFFLLTTGALFSDFGTLGYLASQIDSTTFAIAFGFLLTGFISMTSIAPSRAPSTVSALIFGSTTSIALYGFVRCILFIFPSLDSFWFTLPVLLIGAIAALGGGITALRQTDIKKMVAFMSISSLGIALMMMGCAMAFQSHALYEAMNVALFSMFIFVTAQTLTISGLFLASGLIGSILHTRDMNAMGGLMKSAPKFSIATLLLVIAGAGIPLTTAFTSHWMLLTTLFSAPHPTGRYILGIGLVVAILGASMILVTITLTKFFSKVFLGESKTEEGTVSIIEPEQTLLLPVAALGALSIAGSFALPQILDSIGAGPLTDIPGTFLGGIISTTLVLRPVVLVLVIAGCLLVTWLLKRYSSRCPWTQARSIIEKTDFVTNGLFLTLLIALPVLPLVIADSSLQGLGNVMVAFGIFSFMQMWINRTASKRGAFILSALFVIFSALAITFNSADIHSFLPQYLLTILGILTINAITR